jgi:hypothetical protein
MISRDTSLVLQFYTPILFPKRAPSTAILLFYRRGFAFRTYLTRIGFARRVFVSPIRGYIARRHRAIVSWRGLRVGCDGDCGVELGGPLAGSVGHGCTSQLSVVRFHLGSTSSMATECREIVESQRLLVRIVHAGSRVVMRVICGDVQSRELGSIYYGTENLRSHA